FIIVAIMDKVRGTKDGVSLRKIDKTPTKSSDKPPIQARSSKELMAKKMKQIKQEKIDKLHETLEGNNREMVQEIVEVVDETPKKTTQKVDSNLDKHNATNKTEKNKLEIPKKRTHEKAKINGGGVPKVDGKLDKPIGAKKIGQPKTMEVVAPRDKEVAQEKPNLSLDTMISKTQCSKKQKRVPTCPSMLIGDYLEVQKSNEIDATKSNNGQKPGSNFHPSSSQPLKVSQNLPLAHVEEPINEEETNRDIEDKGNQFHISR
ncbi:hypothetical protein L195_g045364, partial [Trifolium pratense]